MDWNNLLLYGISRKVKNMYLLLSNAADEIWNVALMKLLYDNNP